MYVYKVKERRLNYRLGLERDYFILAGDECENIIYKPQIFYTKSNAEKCKDVCDFKNSMRKKENQALIEKGLPVNYEEIFTVHRVKVADNENNLFKKAITEIFDKLIEDNKHLLSKPVYLKIHTKKSNRGQIASAISEDNFIIIYKDLVGDDERVIEDVLKHELAHIIDDGTNKSITGNNPIHNRKWWNIYKGLGGVCDEKIYKQFRYNDSVDVNVMAEQIINEKE